MEWKAIYHHIQHHIFKSDKIQPDELSNNNQMRIKRENMNIKRVQRTKKQQHIL
jgi:hypothetical protein